MLSNEKSSTVFSKHQKLWQPEFTVIENVRFYLQKRVTKFLKWQQYILRDLLKHLITKMETYKLETCNRHLPQSNLNGMYFSCFHSWKLQILYSTHSPWIFNSAFLKVTRVANNPNTNYYIKKVQLIMIYFVTNDLLEIEAFCELYIEITLVMFFLYRVWKVTWVIVVRRVQKEKRYYIYPVKCQSFLKKTLRTSVVLFMDSLTAKS